MPLSLRYYGDPILRHKADPISEVTDEVRQLVEEMIEVMYTNDGGGLAAPQVGKSIRLFIIDLYLYAERDYDDPNWLRQDPDRVMVFINPKLESPSSHLTIESEGCLSFPGIRIPVARPDQITVTAMNLNGEFFTETLTDYQARAVMHENDHLNGVLHIDRAEARERKKIEPYLEQLRKKYGTAKSNKRKK